MVIRRHFIVQGGIKLRAPVEGGEIHDGKVPITVNNHKQERKTRQDCRHNAVALGTAKVMEGRERNDAQQEQNHIFPETLRMRQVDGLPKAAAVHAGIEHPQHKRDDGEKTKQHVRQDRRHLPEHAGNERYAHGSLCHRQRDAQPLGRRHEPRHLEITEILLQDEHSAHRVYHL